MGSICWRCQMALAPRRPSLNLTTPSGLRYQIAPLSTSTSRLAAKPAPKRGERKLQLGKFRKQDVVKSRPVAPGERKAVNKRIVLSNTNAFEVSSLVDLSHENVADASLNGRMVGIPGPIVDSLRALDAFKHTQGWGFFRRPATLMRKDAAQLAALIGDISLAETPQTERRLIVGERGSGKSVLLLQAMAMAFSKGWVVIHIPEAQDLTIGHTEYSPIDGTSPVIYEQKTYIAQLLSRIAKANEAVLRNFSLAGQHKLPVSMQPNISLLRLAELGGRDPEIAWPIFKALWSELTSSAPAKLTPDASENTPAQLPPILLSLDGMAHISRLSQYLAPSMHHIHAYDLALVQHFMRYFSPSFVAQQQQPSILPRGGLILASDCNGNRPATPSLDLAIRQNESLATASTKSNTALPSYDPEHPYTPVDERVLHALQGIQVLRLRGLSRDEARVLLEYYAASGMLHHAVTDEFVSEKWTLAGNGVAGELERNCLRYAI